MVKQISSLLFLLVLLGSLSFVIAQDQTKKSTCDLAQVQANLDELITSLGQVRSSKVTDPVKLSNTLQEAANNANVLRATCDGLSFSDKNQKVIGPVIIPVGIYRAKVTTKDGILVTVNPVDGECGSGTRTLLPNIFIIFGDGAADGAETIFTSKGCTALIEMSAVHTDWLLEFERISS